MAITWNDESRAKVVSAYNTAMGSFDTDEEKASASVEVTKQLADEFDATPNGVRMILNKAGVYIKAATKVTKASDSKEGGSTKRVNKAEAIQALKNLIAAQDADLVDDAILDKLTGKAAAYFAGVISQITPTEEV